MEMIARSRPELSIHQNPLAVEDIDLELVGVINSEIFPDNELVKAIEKKYILNKKLPNYDISKYIYAPDAPYKIKE
jgi:hypothetical protein